MPRNAAACLPSRQLIGRSLLRRLDALHAGRLTLEFPDGRTRVFTGHEPGLQARIRLTRPYKLAARVALRGSVGFAEGYIAGEWDSPDLARLLQLLAQNLDALEQPGESLLGSWSVRLLHKLRRNSRRGSRRNIAYHYDLGNDFYRLWLDPGMSYSAAVFELQSQSLVEAQDAKYARMAQLAELHSGDSVLEIGCGWGGFAEHAARLGCQLKGITLSTEQLEWARERVQLAQLSEQASLQLEDYRDQTEQFDAIVSIEMLEAVGEQWWPTYFETLYRCLKPGGRAAIQVITIADKYFDDYRRGADFIQRYIFPGGMLPTQSLVEQLARDAGLRPREKHHVGSDYAHTLALWRERFDTAGDEIDALGYDDNFRRLWHYYLAYCEAGFNTGRIDVLQIALEKPADASH
jgi:cyclopropane-fatty-acyl-phospholipid synthase